MTKPKGYWIVHIDVTDAENYPAYIAADKIAFDKYEVKVLVRGGQCTGPEGAIRARHVVLEFETYEKALECYRSDEYQKAIPLRQAYSRSDIVIVEGVE